MRFARAAAGGPALALSSSAAFFVATCWLAAVASVSGLQLALTPLPSNPSAPTILYRINVDSTVGSEVLPSPAAASLGSSIVQLTTGQWLCGLRSDGEPRCDAAFGVAPPPGVRFTQLVSTPSMATNRPTASAVCGLQRHTGALFCWGLYTQLLPLPPPTQPFTKVSLGQNFGCGIARVATNTSAGPLVCFGSMAPDGTPSGAFLDVACAGAMRSQCCAIGADASVQCWGWISRQPLVPLGNRYVQIVATVNTACVIDFNGQVSCFMLDLYSDPTPQAGLLALTGLYSQITALETWIPGTTSTLSRLCGVLQGGTISCAGLGATTPASLSLTTLSVGNTMACGLTALGAPICWADPSAHASPSPPLASYADPTSGGQLSFSAIDVGLQWSCGTVPQPSLNGSMSVVCWNDTAWWTAPHAPGNFSRVNGACVQLVPSGLVSCWFPNAPPAPVRCDGGWSAVPYALLCFDSSFGIGVINYWTTGQPNWQRLQGGPIGDLAAKLLFMSDAVGGIPSVAVTYIDNSVLVWSSLYGTGLYARSSTADNVTLACAGSYAFNNNNGAFVVDGVLTGYGSLESAGLCAYTGSVQALSCGANTGCFLNTLGQPTCWGTNPGFTAQTPTQEPVASLAPRGAFFSPTAGAAQSCPRGTYSVASGSVTPLCSGQCAPGTFTSGGVSNTSVCPDTCPQGSYCAQGATGPQLCPAGVFGSATGLSQPTCTLPCPTGYYCPPGSTAPTASACPAGTYGPAPGLGSASACPPCAVGQFSAAAGSVLCNACPVGSYGLQTGLTGCQSCNGISGITCSGGTAQTEDNFWTYVDTEANGGADGGSLVSVSCPGGFCLAGNRCGTGRIPFESNPMCGLCDEGYTPFSNDCIPCTKPNYGLLVVFLLSTFLYVFIMYHLSQEKGGGDIKIFLYFIATSQFMLGSNFSYWLGWMGILNYNPFKASGGICVVPLDEYQNMALDVVLPLMFLGELVLFGVCHWLFERVYRHFFGAIPRRYAFRVEAYVTAFMSLLIGSYSTITDACFSYINCVAVQSDLVMWSAPAIDCRSARYKAVLVGIGALIAFPVIGLPLVALPLLMWCGRERLDGQTPGVIYKAVAEFTFKTYLPRFWWWEIWAISRRCALVALSSILFRYPVQRSQSFCILNLVVLLSQLYSHPFRSAVENRMESLSLLLLCLLSIILIGQETHLTTGNAVIATLLVAAPIFVFIAWKSKTEMHTRFGDVSSWRCPSFRRTGATTTAGGSTTAEDEEQPGGPKSPLPAGQAAAASPEAEPSVSDSGKSSSALRQSLLKAGAASASDADTSALGSSRPLVGRGSAAGYVPPPVSGSSGITITPGPAAAATAVSPTGSADAGGRRSISISSTSSALVAAPVPSSPASALHIALPIVGSARKAAPPELTAADAHGGAVSALPPSMFSSTTSEGQPHAPHGDDKQPEP